MNSPEFKAQIERTLLSVNKYNLSVEKKISEFAMEKLILENIRLENISLINDCLIFLEKKVIPELRKNLLEVHKAYTCENELYVDSLRKKEEFE
jgi:predicted nuclease of restriction endonuclease-like (RecB) superfamily